MQPLFCSTDDDHQRKSAAASSGRAKPLVVVAVPAYLLLLALAMPGCEKKLAPETETYVTAEHAIAAGDTDAAIEILTKSIDTKPTVYALLDRAKLYKEMGEIDKAIADCEAGLQIKSDHADLKWFLAECKKPEPKRFKGRFAKPPSAYK